MSFFEPVASSLVEIKAPPDRVINLAAERSVLGGILLNSHSFGELAATLRPEDFSLDANRIIYGRMSGMDEANQAINSLSLIDELVRHNELAKVGDVGYVTDLMGGAVGGDLASHARIVKEKAHLRKLVQTSKLGIERVYAGEASCDVAASLADAALDIQAYSAGNRAVRPRDFLVEVREELEAQSRLQGLIGLPTGLESLDEVTGGLRLGELVVVGARPGAGKSALACQILAANCERGVESVMFSLEMSRSDIGRRFIAMTSSVTSKQLRFPYLISEDGWRIIGRAMADIAQWPLLIDDTGSIHVGELLARAKAAITKTGAKVVVVDYLQLVRADGRELRERVGKVANALRLLAKSEKVSVVLLSQLRRPQSVNDEPTLIDLKESGDIEAHAHVVLLIHSPIAEDGSPKGEDRIIIGKNRNGIRGSIAVKFVGDKLTFFGRTYDVQHP